MPPELSQPPTSELIKTPSKGRLHFTSFHSPQLEWDDNWMGHYLAQTLCCTRWGVTLA